MKSDDGHPSAARFSYFAKDGQKRMTSRYGAKANI